MQPDSDDLRHIRDIVNVIEERLPGGRRLTTIVLGLLLTMVGVWAFLYLWHNAIAPISQLLAALIHGATFDIRFSLADLLNIVLSSILIILWPLVYFKLRSQVSNFIEAVHETRVVVEEGNRQGDEVLEWAQKIDKKCDALEARVVILETKTGQ